MLSKFLKNNYEIRNLCIQWCDTSYNKLKEIDSSYSNYLKIPESIKLTSIKPSGTVSLLNGSTPGIHWPESKYYIRRIRIPKNSSLIKPLLSSNYKVEEASEDNTSYVVEFPVETSKNNLQSIHDITVEQQLEMTSHLQKYWADNQVSATITFDKKKEGHKLSSLLNKYQYKLKGISFLPKFENNNAYPQMPYEKIDENTYHEMKNKLLPIDFTNKTSQDTIEHDRVKNQFCDNDTCEN